MGWLPHTHTRTHTPTHRPPQWPSGYLLNWYESDLLQLVKIYLFSSRSFQVIIYQENKSIFLSKGALFHFTSRVHLIWAQSFLIQHTLCGTSIPLSNVLHLHSSGAKLSFANGFQNLWVTWGESLCQPLNNNTNIYIKTEYLLPLSFSSRYNYVGTLTR